MAKVEIYTASHCAYCVHAKRLLETKGIVYTEIRIDEYPEKREEMIARSNRRTVPQIFINDHGIGGYDDMYALNQTGQLDKLLREQDPS